jgi:hypothetical protein
MDLAVFRRPPGRLQEPVHFFVRNLTVVVLRRLFDELWLGFVITVAVRRL